MSERDLDRFQVVCHLATGRKRNVACLQTFQLLRNLVRRGSKVEECLRLQ
jgi:hypothetical protein